MINGMFHHETGEVIYIHPAQCAPRGPIALHEGPANAGPESNTFPTRM